MMKNLTAKVALFTLILPVMASAAAYIKIGDIKGEALDKNNASEVQAVRWMAPESLQKKEYSRAAQAQPGTVSFTKYIDKSSPKLAESLQSGGVIGEMALADGDKQFLLKQVKIVSIQKKGKQEVVTARFNVRQEFGPVQRAASANHNTTRSNRTQPLADAAPAQDYNSSRSNN